MKSKNSCFCLVVSGTKHHAAMLERKYTPLQGRTAQYSEAQHSTAQRSVAGLRFASEGQQVVHVVNAKELAKALEDDWAVVLPLEAAAIVAAQVLTHLHHSNVRSAWQSTM